MRLDQDDGHHPTNTPTLVGFQALSNRQQQSVAEKGYKHEEKTLRYRYKGRPKAEGKTDPKKKISVKPVRSLSTR